MAAAVISMSVTAGGMPSDEWATRATQAVIVSASEQSTWLFVLGTGLIGLGSGLFGHGTLTATMNAAPPDQTGLALGAWGAVQATAAGLAIALGGIIRDVVASQAPR